jgi:hypothetical protein
VPAVAEPADRVLQVSGDLPSLFAEIGGFARIAPLFRTWVGAVGSSLRAVLPPTAPAFQGRLFIR